jgi:hypothetical protein
LRNLVLRLKKTGVTKKWLSTLIRATPDFKSCFVSRILELKGFSTNLMLVLKLIEADGLIGTEFSIKFIQKIMGHEIT